MIELDPCTAVDMDSFIASFRDSELARKYFPSEEKIIETFKEFTETGTLLAARDGHESIGFICFIPKGAFHAFPYLHLLTILPKHRGCGYGKQILSEFEKRMRKISSKLFLVVADFNPEARTFYIKNGYTEVGRIPGLYREGIEEFLMMKLL